MPVTVLRACVTAILMYGLPILAIVCVLPKSQITGVGGFMDAVKAVLTPFGGHSTVAADGSLNVTLTGFGKALGYLAAFGFVLALVSSACTWLMGSDRSQAVAAYDGCGPRWLGTFSGEVRHPDQCELHVRRAFHDRVHLRLAAQRRCRQDLRGDDRRRCSCSRRCPTS